MSVTIGLVTQITIALSLLFALGGLWLGLSLDRGVENNVKQTLSWFGSIIGVIIVIVAFIMALAEAESVMAYELCGLLIVLSSFCAFLGIGLHIGPPRRGT